MDRDMGTEVSAPEGDEEKHPTNIKWSERMWRIANRLAAERDMDLKQLLEALVLLEADNPRIPMVPPTAGYAKEFGLADKHAAEAAELADELLKKARRKK